MGSYLVPTTVVREAADHAELNGLLADGQRWEPADGGVLFVDPGRTDAECAALYADFTASGATEDSYRQPLPDGVRTHLSHLRDYLTKDPAQITNAESVHVIKDLIRAVHYLNSRLADEG